MDEVVSLAAKRVSIEVKVEMVTALGIQFLFARHLAQSLVFPSASLESVVDFILAASKFGFFKHRSSPSV